jgi:predicted  nucleic acid-binding Zn-ribbon protein
MPTKASAKKVPKKITLDDLLKSQDEAWKAIRETQQAAKETHDSIFGLDKSKEEAWAAIRETQQAVKETQQAVKETHDSIFGLDKSKDEAWVARKSILPRTNTNQHELAVR